MKLPKYFIIVCLALTNVGCTTVAGMSASAAINHTLNGIVYQTITAPPSKVRSATVNALKRMKIDLVSDKMMNNQQTRQITAKTKERNIHIELETISPNTTRMRVTAKKPPFIFDSSTAEEIIAQTLKGVKPA